MTLFDDVADRPDDAAVAIEVCYGDDPSRTSRWLLIDATVQSGSKAWIGLGQQGELESWIAASSDRIVRVHFGPVVVEGSAEDWSTLFERLGSATPESAIFESPGWREVEPETTIHVHDVTVRP